MPTEAPDLISVREISDIETYLLEQAAAQQPCPACECAHYGIEAHLTHPGTALPGDLYQVEALHGWSPATNAVCAVARGRSVRDGLTSEWAFLSVPEDCIPVPEPTLSLMLGVGLAWLIASFVVGSLLGRRLRRLGNSYPEVTESSRGRKPPACPPDS